jgi:hypothetical protein
MARETHVRLVDDLDGSDADETVTFGLDGSTYDIELSAKNAAALRDALAPYMSTARKAGSGGGSRGRRAASSAPRRAAGNESAEIRSWARANGHQVNERGRIPAAVVDAFRAAQ